MTRFVEHIPKALNVAGTARGWFHRLTKTRRQRELDVLEEERRLERQRIARELHDTLLQGVLAAALIVDRILQDTAEDLPANASLNRASQLMHRAIAEGRDVLQGLRSPMVSSGSLEREFSDLLRETAKACGVEAQIVVVGKPAVLRSEIQDQLYLIAREALVNALRHASATRIEVEVGYSQSNVRVMIRDNGCGIDERIVQSGHASHWGLQRMRERAKGIGADVRIYSRQGAGTEVEISLPSVIAMTD